jgi:hypothetical protein
MKKIKLFCMQKDEDDILNEWILYHAYLFGLENIYIIDNGSGEASKSILEFYESQGLNVSYRDDYSRKGEYLFELIKETSNECDIAIPLDLDEFIGVVNLQNVLPEYKHMWAQQCLSYNSNSYQSLYPEVRDECLVHKLSIYENYIKMGLPRGRRSCYEGEEKEITQEDAENYCQSNQQLILKNCPHWAISCDRDQILNELEQLKPYGRYAFIYYLTSLNTELEYENPIEDVILFNKED